MHRPNRIHSICQLCGLDIFNENHHEANLQGMK